MLKTFQIYRWRIKGKKILQLVLQQLKQQKYMNNLMMIKGSVCSSFDHLTDSDSSDNSRDSDDFLTNPLADDVCRGYM